MKFPTAFLTLFLTLVVVNASTPYHARSLGARHSRISAAIPALQKRSTEKRCKNRNKSPSGSSTQKPQPSATTGTTKPANNNSGGGGSSGGVLAGSSKCGGSGAVASSTKTSGPNGSIDFLNCGINGGGWSPPSIHIKDVIVKPLSEAIKTSGSPFHACSPYLSFFNKYGDQFGIPPIFLASFAMQESSCQPGTVGGAGEQGLMQITKDKCGGAPRGDCRDPDFNIRTGAKFFADTLASNNGNVLESIGQYNGWYPGLTVAKATAARHTSCCRCQQNLDYLHQFLNGWCQNIDAYSHGLGKYFNLNVC